MTSSGSPVRDSVQSVQIASFLGDPDPVGTGTSLQQKLHKGDGEGMPEPTVRGMNLLFLHPSTLL